MDKERRVALIVVTALPDMDPAALLHRVGERDFLTLKGLPFAGSCGFTCEDAVSDSQNRFQQLPRIAHEQLGIKFGFHIEQNIEHAQFIDTVEREQSQTDVYAYFLRETLEFRSVVLHPHSGGFMPVGRDHKIRDLHPYEREKGVRDGSIAMKPGERVAVARALVKFL